jgi:TonB family protein
VYPKYTAEALAGTRGGNIELSVVISQSGVAQDIRVVKSLGKGLDETAIAALRQTKFKAATYKGQAVSTRGTAVLHVTCVGYTAESPPEISDYAPAEDAQKHPHWKKPLTDCGLDPKLLRRGVCAPMLVNRTAATIGLAEMNGTVIMSIKIDEQGFVRDIRIVTPAEKELNERATAAVHEWRFRPALYKGQPFMVRARLQLRFWWSCAPSMYWGLVP